MSPVQLLALVPFIAPGGSPTGEFLEVISGAADIRLEFLP